MTTVWTIGHLREHMPWRDSGSDDTMCDCLLVLLKYRVSSFMVKTFRFNLYWLYLAMVVFMHRFLVESFAWRLLRLTLQGRHSWFHLQWLDIAAIMVVRRYLPRCVVVRESSHMLCTAKGIGRCWCSLLCVVDCLTMIFILFSIILLCASYMGWLALDGMSLHRGQV